MKRKTSKLLSLLLAAALLFPIGAPAALAAGTADAVHLRTAGDLAELSRNCALDSWSQGKTVYLEADIDLTGVDFAPIPTFGGTFEGQDHTISGLSLTGSGNARGLFRYIQPDGAVRDLHVSGSIAPSGRENTLGGLAGENRGTITNCSFSGTVSGADSVGGLVGVNEAQGRLINCSFSGSVTGEHYVGGIAGQNYGSIVQCGNSGSINTTEVDAELNLDNLNQERLNAAENVPVCTDIGGIAGFSSGILQSCVNTGAVGYAHVGYNIGGIVGRQSGNLNGCANSGTVLGRKDVGGVAGQLEPEVRLLYEEGKLGQLMDELDTLSSLIRRTGEDIQDSSDELSKRMRDLQDQAEDVRDAVDDLAAWAGDLADEAAGVIGDLSDRISRLIEKLLSILEDAVGAADLAEKLAGRLEEAARQAQEAGELSPDEAEQLLKAAEALRAAARDVREAAERLEAAEERLRNALGDQEQTAAALEEAADAAGRLMEALSRMGDAAAQAAGSWGGGGAGMAQEDLAALRAALAAVSASLEKVETTITANPGGSRGIGAALREAFSDLLDDGDDLMDAMSDASDLLLEDMEDINEQLGAVTDLFQDILDGSDEEFEDRFEDVSDQASETTDTGYLSGARNDGVVEGDINVAGIVGAMAIEYDFDPEDDLVREGDRSLDFRYQVRAVVLSCVNTGEITGKQDHVGGIAGLMDLGRVSGCESYGAVTSTDGDYVGGIAGASWGSIRDSWSKCRLSGQDYVGGVAGLGATLVNCHTLVTIDEGSAYLGAVAGDVDDGGTVSGNTFTSESLGALDGISYAGKAEPVDFDALCATEGVPELFSRMELTFVADGTTVAVIPFRYGEGIESLPELPAKKGYSASWPDLDYTHLTAGRTLEAEYTPYTSALTDGGELPEILVDGSFSSRAEISHTTEAVTWTDDRGQTRAGTAYTVRVTDPDLEQVSYTVHCRLPKPGRRCALWVQDENGWSQADFEIDGQYLLLTSQTEEITFCITERFSSPFAWIAAGTGSLLLLAVILRALRRPGKKPR